MTVSTPAVCGRAGCQMPTPRRRARFCSRACYVIAIQPRKTPTSVPTPTCAHCGSGSVRRGRQYCSRACAGEAKRLPTTGCRQCGSPAPRADRPFCGLRCWRIWQCDHPTRPWLGKRRPEISGELHPRWKGDDVSDAGARRRTLRRYGVARRCKHCHLPAVRHHRDGNPRNGAPGNIHWLCRGCLARLYRHRVRRRVGRKLIQARVARRVVSREQPAVHGR